MAAILAALILIGAASPSSAAQPELLSSMRQALGWQRPESGSREQRALDRALQRLLETPTGEALAREFVAEGARAVVEFADLPGELVDYGGRRELAGQTASTNRRGSPPVIQLNRLLLRESPELRDADVPATLAHELFGHGLEILRANRAAVPYHVYAFVWDDELNARLIGWLARLELGSPLPDDSMAVYLRDPQEYARQSFAQSATYATALSRREMRDPLGAVRSRIAAVDAARDANDAGSSDAAYREMLRGRIADSRAAIASQIEMWLHGDRELRSAADHPHLVELESRVARLTETLRARAGAAAAAAAR